MGGTARGGERSRIAVVAMDPQTVAPAPVISCAEIHQLSDPLADEVFTVRSAQAASPS